MVEYPMLFKLSASSGQSTHSGVLEFSAPEGSCYIPFWMMQNLLLQEGSLLTVKNISLPKASFVKLQPQSVDFLEISNPRAVLEHALRKFSCLTKGDVICIPYNGKNYHFEIKDLKPQDAACIIETDCNVDFDAPVGYVQPDYRKEAADRQREQYKAMPKQSRLGGEVSAGADGGGKEAANEKEKGPRIVNGAIVNGDQDTSSKGPDAALVADKIGATGVQRNAALPPPPATNQYWAVAGGGARLDGKAPSPLKDKDGKEVDPRELRAAAAAARAAASNPTQTAAPQVKRKSLVGNKYSKRKVGGAVAFDGGGNKMI